MTMKERLKMHDEIERQNKEKIEAWFEKLKNHPAPYALRMGKFKYLAVLENALVIVTEDENHKPIRYDIFKRGCDA